MKVKYTTTVDVDLAKWAFEYGIDPKDTKEARRDLLLAMDNVINLLVQDYQQVSVKDA